jgi:hypothetical protein
MKTSIIQILSGVLILVLIVIFTQFVLPGYHNDIVLDKNGNVIGQVMGLQLLNIPLIIWSVIYFFLGMVVFICGVIQLIFTWRNKANSVLTVIQFSLGLLIIGSMIFFLVTAEPRYTLYARIIEDGSRISIWQKDPSWIFHQIFWKEAAFIPGLLIIVCGITDFLKLNKAKGRELDTFHSQ